MIYKNKIIEPEFKILEKIYNFLKPVKIKNYCHTKLIPFFFNFKKKMSRSIRSGDIIRAVFDDKKIDYIIKGTDKLTIIVSPIYNEYTIDFCFKPKGDDWKINGIDKCIKYKLEFIPENQSKSEIEENKKFYLGRNVYASFYSSDKDDPHLLGSFTEIWG